MPRFIHTGDASDATLDAYFSSGALLGGSMSDCHQREGPIEDSFDAP